MGTVYLRGKVWWVGWTQPANNPVRPGQRTWFYRSTGYLEADEARARATLKEIESAVSKGEAVALQPATFEGYATSWATERGGRRAEDRVWTAARELGRLKAHVFPVIGRRRLVQLRPRDIRDLVKHLKTKVSQETGEALAGKTVRNVYGVVRRCLSDAVADELLEHSPCVLKSGDLPAVGDKDPEWREAAQYTRAEVEQLISDDRIPFNRRVWWALGFLTGMRAGEIAALCWRHYDPAATPLGSLRVIGSFNSEHGEVKSTKTKRYRLVPVHPTLARLLAEWRLTGWASMQGRPPAADDFLLVNERGNRLSDAATKKTRPRDLKKLGMRVRRFHDARSTFITLASEDGGDEIWLERVTHNARGSQLNQYRRSSWLKMCEAISCLNVSPRGGTVATLPIAVRPGAQTDPERSGLPTVVSLREAGERSEVAGSPGAASARSEGLEPSTAAPGSHHTATLPRDSATDRTTLTRAAGPLCSDVGSKTADLKPRLDALLARFHRAGGVA